MDYEGYDDIQQLNQSRHGGNSKNNVSGGSDYVFGDGSARFLKYGRAFSPLNLWATTDYWRQLAVPYQ